MQPYKSRRSAELRTQRKRLSSSASPTLQAACLTAGLVTAFATGADCPADAQIVTNQGNEIFGAVFVESVAGSFVTLPLSESRPISDAPSGAKGIVVNEGIFGASGFSDLVGADFSATFGVDEAAVLSYLVDGNVADQASYETFLANLPENFIINSTYTSSGADAFPGDFVLFSSGTNIGTPVNQSTSNPVDTHFAFFGVALEPAASTPEPSAILAMLLGGLGVAGQSVLWRRRQTRLSSQDTPVGN